VPYEEYARAAHFRRAQQIGAATCKELGHTPTRVARARGAVLGVVSPAGNGRTAQAPVEWVSWDELPGDERPAMPAMFDTPRLADLWRRHRFPRGDTPLWRDARDPRACWRVYLALKGKGKRPGLEFQGKPWQAYDLVLALASAEEMGIDDQDLPGFLLWLKIQLKSGKLSADHLCEEWMGTEAKLCIRREHLDWDDKLGNVAAHWDRWHAAKTAREGVA
jgi:hypothetical protein